MQQSQILPQSSLLTNSPAQPFTNRLPPLSELIQTLPSPDSSAFETTGRETLASRIRTSQFPPLGFMENSPLTQKEMIPPENENMGSSGLQAKSFASTFETLNSRHSTTDQRPNRISNPERVSAKINSPFRPIISRPSIEQTQVSSPNSSEGLSSKNLNDSSQMYGSASAPCLTFNKNPNKRDSRRADKNEREPKKMVIDDPRSPTPLRDSPISSEVLSAEREKSLGVDEQKDQPETVENQADKPSSSVPAEKPTQKNETVDNKEIPTESKKDDQPESESDEQTPENKESTDDGSGDNKRGRRNKLPDEATQVLKEWLRGHWSCPYPTEAEKLSLVSKTGLTWVQINNWFANARRAFNQQQNQKMLFHQNLQQLQATAQFFPALGHLGAIHPSPHPLIQFTDPSLAMDGAHFNRIPLDFSMNKTFYNPSDLMPDANQFGHLAFRKRRYNRRVALPDQPLLPTDLSPSSPNVWTHPSFRSDRGLSESDAASMSPLHTLSQAVYLTSVSPMPPVYPRTVAPHFATSTFPSL